MKKVLLFSLLLIAGLAGSQALPQVIPGYGHLEEAIQLLTMFCLAFIMIHVGYEFEIDRSNLKQYAVDYGVAATAAAFPWIFVAVYFVVGIGSSAGLGVWKEALLTARFAAPTSAGILFSMLAAAGLSATWLFRKARVLAIFDDLDTVLLMIPLKMLIVGVKWQLGAAVMVMAVLLWLAWRYLHILKLPVTWRWVMVYAAVVTLACDLMYRLTKLIDDVVPVHIEVLLPAFVLGCMLARPEGRDPHADDSREGHQEGPESGEEQRISTLVSAVFMVLVGLSMPSFVGGGSPIGAEGSWGTLILHVAVVTLLANIGKMFPVFCYRKDAHWRDRLALSVGMFPRGEVGAGVLVVSLSYGVSQAMVAVAVLALALNLLLTGLFIYVVKKLLVQQGS